MRPENALNISILASLRNPPTEKSHQRLYPASIYTCFPFSRPATPAEALLRRWRWPDKPQARQARSKATSGRQRRPTALSVSTERGAAATERQQIGRRYAPNTRSLVQPLARLRGRHKAGQWPLRGLVTGRNGPCGKSHRAAAIHRINGVQARSSQSAASGGIAVGAPPLHPGLRHRDA
jgi:hypothetical protein